jgi:hypothetical protein
MYDLLTSAKSTKVLGRLGHDIGPQCHDDTSGGLAANGDIEVAHGVGPGEGEREK